MRGLFKGASTHKTFGVTSSVIVLTKNLLMFVYVSIIYGKNFNLQLGKVKKSSGNNYKNAPITFLARDGQGKCCGS